MDHPIPVGTMVIALIEHCKTCGGADKYTKVSTRVRDFKLQDDGTYSYTMLDGQVVAQQEILEVR